MREHRRGDGHQRRDRHRERAVGISRRHEVQVEIATSRAVVAKWWQPKPVLAGWDQLRWRVNALAEAVAPDDEGAERGGEWVGDYQLWRIGWGVLRPIGGDGDGDLEIAPKRRGLPLTQRAYEAMGRA